MTEKQKTKEDRTLINKLFGFEPVDWARYPDGTLAFISPTGQKYSYADEELQEIDLALKEKQKLQKPAPKPAASATPKGKTPASAAPAKKKTK